MKTRNTEELLKKVQKGATAGFNVADWECVLEALGWGFDEYRVGRERSYGVKAPNGDVFKLEKKAGYRVITFYDFIKWAKEHDLLAAVEAKVGPVPAKAPRRDMTNTGTCACCFGNFKLTEVTNYADNTQVKRMVLHGYQRPGHGYIIGNCPGVRFQPYELSCEGTQYMLGLVNAAVEDKRGVIAMLKTTTELWFKRWNEESRKYESAIMQAGDWRFEGERHSQLQTAGYELNSMKRDQATLTAKVRDWKLAPLPGSQS